MAKKKCAYFSELPSALCHTSVVMSLYLWLLAEELTWEMWLGIFKLVISEAHCNLLSTIKGTIINHYIEGKIHL